MHGRVAFGRLIASWITLLCYGEATALCGGWWRFGKRSCLRRLLHTLRVRYTLDMIYTYSGNILIAVSQHIGMHPHK